jgi:hypothetical protein
MPFPQERLDFALQLSPIDQAAALDLCVLIADLQAAPRHDLTFFLVWRKDCDLSLVGKAVGALSDRFDVRGFQAFDHAEGWPAGCAALWHSSITTFQLARQQGWTNATGVFTFEADVCPLRADWIDCLQKEWRDRREGTLALGHWHGEGESLHLNGNSAFHADIFNAVPRLHGQPEWASWDFYHREALLSVSQDTPYVTQVYKMPSIERWQFRRVKKGGVRPAVLHGVKDGSARDAARKLLL